MPHWHFPFKRPVQLLKPLDADAAAVDQQAAAGSSTQQTRAAMGCSAQDEGGLGAAPLCVEGEEEGGSTCSGSSPSDW